MAKNNRTVLVLSLLIVASLLSVAAALVWFGVKLSSDKSPSTTAASPSQTPVQYSSLAQVPLTSERQVDYSKLREYLQQKAWRAADRETYLRLLDAAGPKAQASGFTPQDEMEGLSCTDLRTIDNLWHAASDGQQGFTAQMNILKALGGDYRKLYAKVGWQELPPSNRWLFEWDYNPQARRMEFKPGKEPNYQDPLLPGHLPTVEIGYNLDVAFSGALRRCNF